MFFFIIFLGVAATLGWALALALVELALNTFMSLELKFTFAFSILKMGKVFLGPIALLSLLSTIGVDGGKYSFFASGFSIVRKKIMAEKKLEKHSRARS